MQAPLSKQRSPLLAFTKKMCLHGLEYPDYAHFMLEDPIFSWSSPGSLEHPGF